MVQELVRLMKVFQELRSQALHGELSASSSFVRNYLFTMFLTLTKHDFSAAMERKLAVDLQHVSALFPRILAFRRCVFF